MVIQRITSTSNELVRHAYTLLREKEYRLSTQSTLVEGKNLLLDLLKTHTPKRLFVTEKQLPFFSHHVPEIIVISDHISQKISQLPSPEGCFAEIELPQQTLQQPFNAALILDRVQDPGNVGTLLRTALAFTVTTIFFIEPCCDPWNPKAVRAGKGAQFSMQIVSTSWEKLAYYSPEYAFFIADLKGESINTVIVPKKWMLVLGNEAHGPFVPHNIAKKDVTIPMGGAINSLNVAQAGAILLFTFTTIAVK